MAYAHFTLDFLQDHCLREKQGGEYLYLTLFRRLAVTSRVI